MRKSLMLCGFLALSGGIAYSQPVTYQAPKSYGFSLRADALVRQEWTRDIFVSTTETRDESRRRFQVRPHLEISANQFLVAVGGDFNYSSDKNTSPASTLLRDNYKSRDARLDLAFLSLMPSGGLQIQGGRMPMPIDFTEMIWDRDLRPQGGAVTLRSRDQAGFTRFGVTVLGARGSHVFEDKDTDMVVVSGTLGAQAGLQSRMELTGSYVKYTTLGGIAPFIRRQNTRSAAGDFVNRYEIVDIVGRLRSTGSVPAQLTADYCWNTAVDQDRSGLWLAASAGSVRTSPLRAEYVYARVDKDATLAAYATDDFFWSTGWTGHRLDLGTRASEHASLHVVGQLQRFKDSPREAERDHWVKRVRLEMRYSY